MTVEERRRAVAAALTMELNDELTIILSAAAVALAGAPAGPWRADLAELRAAAQRAAAKVERLERMVRPDGGGAVWGVGV